jgi:hypothetical protein
MGADLFPTNKPNQHPNSNKDVMVASENTGNETTNQSK